MALSTYLKPLAFTLLPHIGGIAGGLITKNNIKNWYDKDVIKPWWRPPNWLFGPVWTMLYTGMGYASYMIYRDGGGFDGPAAIPLALYGAQLALNWAWTPIFFGCRRMGLAAVEITVLTGTIFGTIYSFHDVNADAAHLLLPYLAWTSFAACLNWNIYLTNKDKQD